MGSMISKSKGDEAGVLGGVVSGKTKGKSITLMFSDDVIMEMRPVIRKSDMAIMNDFNTICLQGWDQGEVEGVEGREWVTIKVVEDDESDPPSLPVKDVKLKVTLPDGSAKQVQTDPGGKVSFVGIEPGTCSVELNEPEGSRILEITDRWPSSGLATKTGHLIAVKIKSASGFCQ
jgi:hypothetical protein